VRQERRDFRKRADTTRRVVTWICGKASAVAEVPRDLVARDAGRRILRRLALRGLLRSTDAGWVPCRWLLVPPALSKIADEAS
jgi:hypothetical protein